MSTDYSELRRLLAEIWKTPSFLPGNLARCARQAQDRRDAIRRQFEAALPGLLDENDSLREELRKAAAHAIRSVDFQREAASTIDSDRRRIAQLETALREIASYDEHYGGTMIEIARAALEGKEST